MTLVESHLAPGLYGSPLFYVREDKKQKSLFLSFSRLLQTFLTLLCFSCHHQSYTTQQTLTLTLNLDVQLYNSECVKRVQSSAHLWREFQDVLCNQTENIKLGL